MSNTDLAIKYLGSLGRMVSHSKSDYLSQNPNNNVVFNGNVCTQNGKIWYGDLDITKNGDKLQNLSNELNEQIFVLREKDGRFENELTPLLDRARASFSPVQ